MFGPRVAMNGIGEEEQHSLVSSSPRSILSAFLSSSIRAVVPCVAALSIFFIYAVADLSACTLILIGVSYTT